MAAAEARAVWQRAVNRCFVQEDAKRAPKLACCQSNSTSKQVNSEQQPPGGSDAGSYPSSVFMPFSQRPPFTSPPDTRWWLLQELSHDFPRCLTSQQLSALDLELEGTKDAVGDPFRKSADMSMQMDDASAVNSVSSDFQSNELMESMELTESYEMVEVCQTDSCATSKKTSVDPLDLDGPWLGNGKNEPWWRTADGIELASFVATKSSDHLENCDLPPPQRVQIRKRPSPYGPFEHQEAVRSSLDWKAHRMKNLGNSWGTVQTPTSSERVETIGEQLTADGDSPFRHGFAFAKSQRVHGEVAEGIGDHDSDKAQLLEALCHSQTRAREAEMAAKQAREEKEHVIQLFFRQASQLFAYKQWFQLLNLEAARQNKTNGEKGVSTLVPVLLPWAPCRGKRVRKRSSKGSKTGQGRRKQARHDVTKYAVVFAVGLGLVGAGLLLGWTVGWMLPLF